MSHHEVLTVRFLQARGVVVPKPLRDWLTRVSFLARAQPDDEKCVRYVKWALGVVEAAAQAPGGVAAVPWAKQSTILPPNTDIQTPAWWPSESATSSRTPETFSVARQALLDETLRRAPAQLHPFVHQGFALYDREVARGQRTYAQVSFVEMLNIARSLFVKAPPTAVAVAAPQPAPSPPPPLPQTGPEPPQLPPPHYASPASIPSSLKEHKKAPAAMPKEFSTASPQPMLPLPSSPAASNALKRAAANHASEPPFKKHFTVPTDVDTAKDLTFFLQLAHIKESDASPPPAFVGKSDEMERKYTRYEPLVEDIRPLPVLRKAFAFITSRSKAMEMADGASNAQKYLSDQLKGLRQDLRVQNIVNSFAMRVYEMHAMLCLEMGDIGEFNQCQAALKQFYTYPRVSWTGCRPKDFFLLRLIYLTLSGQYDTLSTELIHFTNDKEKERGRFSSVMDKDSVNDTLELCDACINGDPATICRLLLAFPACMTHLVRIYLQRLRISWLKEILTAMKGSLTMRFLMASLGFMPVAHSEKLVQSFWLDGSAEDAAAHLVELFETLKVALPPRFSFEAEVARTKHTGPHRDLHFPCLDAATALKAVDAYLVYLGTRKDAGIGS